MAKKGLAIPIIAEYENKGNGVVAYSNPMTADHAVEYSAEIETQESNDLTADNRVQESAPKIFTKGTLNLTTADLPADPVSYTHLPSSKSRKVNEFKKYKFGAFQNGVQICRRHCKKTGTGKYRPVSGVQTVFR